MNKGNGIQSPIYHNEGNGLEYFVNRDKVYCHRSYDPCSGYWWESCFTPDELKHEQFVVKD